MEQQPFSSFFISFSHIKLLLQQQQQLEAENGKTTTVIELISGVSANAFFPGEGNNCSSFSPCIRIEFFSFPGRFLNWMLFSSRSLCLLKGWAEKVVS